MTRATKAKQKELNCSMWEREIRAYQKCEKKNRSPQGNAEDGGFELSAADTGCPAHHPMPLLLQHNQKGKKLMRRVEL